MAQRVRSAEAVGWVALVVVSAITSPAAAQGQTCTYDSDSHSVTVTSESRLRVVDGRISVPGVSISQWEQCGEATVFNTDTIHAIDAYLEFFLHGGPFVPGLTPEPEGESEIEILVQGEFDGAVMTVDGSKARDTFVLGTGGLNVNGDDDVDIVVQGWTTWLLHLGRGNDYASAKGGNGTGDPYERRYFWVYGGVGSDEIAAGRSWARVFGEGGADTLLGGKQTAHRQEFYGGSGRDLVKGGPGDDRLWGDEGNDLVKGGPGDDRLWGDEGNDQLLGGPGIDRCNDTEGRDETHSCERRMVVPY